MTEHDLESYNMQNHQTVSKRLALAIGWNDRQIAVSLNSDAVYVAKWFNPETLDLLLTGAYPVPLAPWSNFDYRDPTVIWPIACALNIAPRKTISEWHCSSLELKCFAYGDTPERAVAKTVVISAMTPEGREQIAKMIARYPGSKL